MTQYHTIQSPRSFVKMISDRFSGLGSVYAFYAFLVSVIKSFFILEISFSISLSLSALR